MNEQFNSDETKHNKKAGTDDSLQVFYSDSEEEAESLAIAYIEAHINRKNQIVERPTILFRDYFLGIILPFSLYMIMTAFILKCFDNIGIWILSFGYLSVFLSTIKFFVVLCILIYQKYMPVKIRHSCRFEPSCSNYMLQAIEKYGFWRGIIKGINRLCRCHYPNGGIDIP